MTAVNFQAWSHARQNRIEEVLRRLLPASDLAPQRLHQAMRYSVLDGGKRVGRLLAYAAGELAGADIERIDITAAAVEFIHVYSLVHDDMPCMDDDALRRGKPTCHVEYDEATALLVGDALQSLAFQLMADHPAQRRSRSPVANGKTACSCLRLTRHGRRSSHRTLPASASNWCCRNWSRCISTRPAP